MTRSLRISLKIFASLLLVLIVAAIALPFVIDPNDYKEEIITQVEKRTGRQLQIRGDIRLSVFPWLGVTLGEVRLGNARGFGADPMLQIQGMDVRVQLLPLLRGRIKLGHVSLKGLELQLARNEQGISNWAGLLPPNPAGKAPTAPPGTKARSVPRAAPLAALALEGLTLSQSHIDWRDATTGQHYALRDLELRIGAITPGQPFPVEATLRFDSTAPEASGKLALRTVLTLDARLQRITARDLDLRQHLRADFLPGGTLDARLRTRQAQLNLEEETLVTRALQAQVQDLAFKGDIEARGILSRPSYQASLVIPPFSLRKALPRFGIPAPKPADPKALTHAELAITLRGTGDQLDISQLQVKLDDSTLSGTGAITNFRQPALRYDLSLDHIDADRYLPPAAEKNDAGPKPAATPGAAAGAAAQLPLDTLRALDIDGKLRIGKLKIMNLRATDILMPFRARQGRLRLAPLSAKLYGGRYGGNILLDVRGKTPKIALDEKLRQAQIGPLLKDLLGEDKITGTADLQASLTARGFDQAAILKTLNGRGRFAFKDGVVKGFDLARMERNLTALLRGQAVPAHQEPRQTGFSSITGSFRITNGLLRNSDLRAALPHARVIGSGTTNLVQEQLDYTLQVKFTSEVAGQSGTRYEQMDKTALPIRITGSFRQPRIEPDYEAVAQDLARRELKKKEQELKQRLNQELEEKAGDLFKGLFQR